jgi:hypothetical protein
MCLACAFIERADSLDPTNRYHFEDQAPVIIPLKGAALSTHSFVMDVMRKHLGAPQADTKG